MIQLQGCEILAVSIVSNPAVLKCRERLRAWIKPRCDSQSGLHPRPNVATCLPVTHWWRCAKSDVSNPHDTSSHLYCLPAPLPVFGVVGEPPHVHVRLDDLRPKDEVLLVLPCGDGFYAAVKAEGLGTQLHTWNTHGVKFITQTFMLTRDYGITMFLRTIIWMWIRGCGIIWTFDNLQSLKIPKHYEQASDDRVCVCLTRDLSFCVVFRVNSNGFRESLHWFLTDLWVSTLKFSLGSVLYHTGTA